MATKCVRDHGAVVQQLPSSDAFLSRRVKELQKLRKNLSRKLAEDLKNLLFSGDHSDLTLTSADGCHVKVHSSIVRTRVPDFFQKQLQLAEDRSSCAVNLDHIHLQRFIKRVYTEDDISHVPPMTTMDDETPKTPQQNCSVDDVETTVPNHQEVDAAGPSEEEPNVRPVPPPLVRRNTFDMLVAEAGPSDVDSGNVSRLDSHALATHIGDSGLGLDSQLSTSSTFGQQSLGSELILDSCRSLPEDDSLEFPLDVIAAPATCTNPEASSSAMAFVLTPDSLADEPHNLKVPHKPSAIVNPYNVQEDARTCRDISERPIVAGFIPEVEADVVASSALEQVQTETQREPFFVFFELDQESGSTPGPEVDSRRPRRVRTTSAQEDTKEPVNTTSFEAQLSRSWDVSIGSGEVSRPPVYMFIGADPSEEVIEHAADEDDDANVHVSNNAAASLSASASNHQPSNEVNEEDVNDTTSVDPADPLDACLPCSKLGRDLLQMFLGEVDTDMTVRVEGRDIKAHKCILSSRCVYFAAMLSGGWLESTGNLVELQGFSYRAVHFALCHIYSGASKIPDDLDVAEVASLADMFGLEGLKEVVVFTFKMNYCHFFHKPCSACVVGVVECLPLAAAYGLEELKDRCLKWINNHMLKTWPTKAFASLPDELLEMCYASAKADINPDTVLDTILHCRKISVTLPQVKWSTPVAHLTARLGDACCRHLSTNMAAVLQSHKFKDLTHGRGWNLASVEAVFLATVDNVPLDVACRTYAHLNSMLVVGEEPEDGFSSMVSKIHRHVERYLIHNANRVVRCTGWPLLSGELQQRIKDAAVIVFEFEKPIAPPPRLSSLNRKFTRTRSQSATVQNRRVASAATLPSASSSVKKVVPARPEDDPKACTLPRSGRAKTSPDVSKVPVHKTEAFNISNPYAATRVSWESSVRLRPQSQSSSAAAAVRPKSWPRGPGPEPKGSSRRVEESTASIPSPAKVASKTNSRPKSLVENKEAAKGGVAEKCTTRHSYPGVGATDAKGKSQQKQKQPNNPVPAANARVSQRGSMGHSRPNKTLPQPRPSTATNGKQVKPNREQVK